MNTTATAAPRLRAAAAGLMSMPVDVHADKEAAGLEDGAVHPRFSGDHGPGASKDRPASLYYTLEPNSHRGADSISS